MSMQLLHKLGINLLNVEKNSRKCVSTLKSYRMELRITHLWRLNLQRGWRIANGGTYSNSLSQVGRRIIFPEAGIHPGILFSLCWCNIGKNFLSNLIPPKQTEATKPVLGKYYRKPKKSGPLPFHLIDAPCTA
ncbi:hypothetical protein SAY87_009799 [Trapa incisa]|uniref:Uncharacterized protein n=1 Tax=Trapa incisa TaxID=236973 RepID=A0AAN7JZD5_9MYRT|nr:hypothetical protein SAY87_009799 [Trapa incisa]